MRKRLLMILPLLAAPHAFAEVDTSEWLCESCPFEDGYRADYETGVTYVSDEDIRAGNATGYDTDGAYLNIDGSGAYSRDGYRLHWRIEDVGLDSRLIDIDAGRQGSYGVSLHYRELPYRQFDSTRTVFASPGGVLRLPTPWTRAATTAGFADLDASLKVTNIESDRNTAGVGMHWLATGSIRLFVDYQSETREGVDIKSGSSFTQASLLPRHIDFATDQVDAGVRFHGENGSLTLAYYGSFFRNRNTALVWETPFTAPSGASRLASAEEPDNNFQQMSLSGAWRADLWDTVLAFSLATGRGEQDDALLGYTSNPDITTPALPVSSLNGEVDTRNYALTITTRPIPRARLRISYRLDERENNTSVNDWTRVITDVFASGETEQNAPYSFERTRFSVAANLRLFDSLRVAAGYERHDVDRDFQEVAEQSEDTGWGQLRWRPAAWLELRARGGASRRDVERYDETVAISLGQNPLLRKYNLAYRYREFAELTASISPAASPVSLTATVHAADDSYSQSRLGMTDGNELRYTADISWPVSENSSAYLLFGSESIEADQVGSAQGGAPDWQASHDDDFDHWSAGFRWRDPDGRFDLRLDYSSGEGDTRIDVTDSGTGSPLPALASSLDSLRVEMAFRKSDKLDITAEIRYESFSSDDWALANVAPDTLPVILTLGASPYDYDVWALGIGFRYFFGGRGPVLTN